MVVFQLGSLPGREISILAFFHGKIHQYRGKRAARKLERRIEAFLRFSIEIHRIRSFCDGNVLRFQKGKQAPSSNYRT
ncbi:hypothetical protein D3C85_1863980 [compost metagenome]